MRDDKLQKEFKRIIKESSAYTRRRLKERKELKEEHPRYSSFEEWEKAHPETVELVNKASWMQDKVYDSYSKKDIFIFYAVHFGIFVLGWVVGWFFIKLIKSL